MKRFIATAAIAALAVTAVFAQGRVQLASPDGYNDGTYQVIWDSQGNYGVFAPLGQDVIIPLHLYVFSKGSPDWNAIAIDLLFDDTRMDVGLYDADGNLVWMSTLVGPSVTFTARQIVTQPNGINALTVGEVKNPDPNDGVVNLRLGIAAGGTNRFRFSDNPAWPSTPHNFYLTVDPDGNPVPMLLKLRGTHVQAGERFSFTAGPDGISFISRGQRPTGSNMVLGEWYIVPEPASMIALGSGLVGLLALRRRKK